MRPRPPGITVEIPAISAVEVHTEISQGRISLRIKVEDPEALADIISQLATRLSSALITTQALLMEAKKDD